MRVHEKEAERDVKLAQASGSVAQALQKLPWVDALESIHIASP